MLTLRKKYRPAYNVYYNFELMLVYIFFATSTYTGRMSKIMIGMFIEKIVAKTNCNQHSSILPCNWWQLLITLTGFNQEKVKTINIFANGFAI